MATVFLRGDMYYSKYSRHGEEVRVPLSRDKRTAERMLDDMRAEDRAKRQGVPVKDLSWEGFKARHLVYSEAEKKQHTQYRDDLAFRMLERYGRIRRLDQLTPEFLLQIVYKWKADGFSGATIARAVDAIKAAMHRAEDWKLAPMQNWRIVKVESPKGRLLYYSMKEYERLLKKTRGRWLTAALLMGRAGLRSAEARHLSFDDILWDERVLWIRSKPCSECGPCQYGGNVWHPKGWKPNKAKERKVDMPKDLEAHLGALPNKQGLVLGPEMLSSAVYEVYFRRLIQNAGLKGSPHTLRHTYASHLVSNGRTLEEVGELLGHEDPETTKIYAHLMPHARRNAVDSLPTLVPSLYLGHASANGKGRNGKD